jgi:hypothetical protein
MKVDEDNDMLSEYDFSSQHGERGKYYQDYRQGHHVRIYRENGSLETHYFTLEEGAVMLEPDVLAYFPNSETVNHVLRGIIALMPSLPLPR